MTMPTILIATWQEGLFAIGADNQAREIQDHSVRSVVSDGSGGALAIVNGHSLLRRSPDGQWQTVATSNFPLSCCVAVLDSIYVGTDEARILRLAPQNHTLEPLIGFDQVPGRTAWFAGSAIVNGQRMGPPLGIRSLAANADATVLFANVHVGGIPRSLDAGTTWQPTIDINADVHEVRAHPADPAIVAAASGVGLCISRDAGATWTIERDGLHAAYCSAVAFSGNDILVSASTEHFASEGRIYRRPLQPGGQIAALKGGLPNGSTALWIPIASPRMGQQSPSWTAGATSTFLMTPAGPGLSAAPNCPHPVRF